MGAVFDITSLPAWNQQLDLQALVARIAGEIGGPSASGDFSQEKITEAIARAWMMGANVALHHAEGLRACRICGCWQLQACAERCGWVAADLCSTCVPIAAERVGGLTCGRCSRPASAPHYCEAC